PESSPGIVKGRLSACCEISSVPMPWKYCHPVRKVPINVESSSAETKSLICHALRTSCPTITAMSSIVNHPIRCQLSRGAAENTHEIPHHTRNKRSGGSSACDATLRSTTETFIAQINIIAQNT